MNQQAFVDGYLAKRAEDYSSSPALPNAEPAASTGVALGKAVRRWETEAGPAKNYGALPKAKELSQRAQQKRIVDAPPPKLPGIESISSK